MQKCIDAYFSLEEITIALRLHQNYAYMMWGETSAFQERYNFDLSRWRDEHSKLCEKYLGNDRVIQI